MKRIDSLKPGTPVRLKFCAEFQGKDQAYEEDAVFVALTGEGNDRRATFGSPDQRVPGEDRVWYQWDAYRYKGRWVYGSSAETLRLVEVKE
jgi:hypothetical protein